jgi:hypothetical protein
MTPRPLTLSAKGPRPQPATTRTNPTFTPRDHLLMNEAGKVLMTLNCSNSKNGRMRAVAESSEAGGGGMLK